MSFSSGRLWVAAVAVATVALGGCASSSADDNDGGGDGVEEHVEGGGPLGSGMGHEGNISLYAPKHKPWDATFGVAMPCRSSSTAPVLDDVTYEYGVEPKRTITTLRTATTGGPQQVSPTGGLRVNPSELPGDLNHDVDGVEVNQQCGSSSNGRHEFTELLATMVVGGRGGSITSVAVEYHVGDQRYRLMIPWRFVACGSATLDTGLC